MTTLEDGTLYISIYPRPQLDIWDAYAGRWRTGRFKIFRTEGRWRVATQFARGFPHTNIHASCSSFADAVAIVQEISEQAMGWHVSR